MNQDTPQPPKKRRIGRLLFRLGVIAILLFLLVTVWINWNGSRARDAVLAELEQRGLWPINTPTLTLGDPNNGAKSFLAAMRLANPEDDTYDTEGLPQWSTTRGPYFGVALSPDMADRIRAYVKHRRDFRAQIEKARQYDSYQYDIDWYDSQSVWMEILATQRAASRNLVVFSLHEQALGHSDAAIDHLVAIKDLKNSFAKQGPLIQWLVSISIDAMINSELAETLSRMTPSHESLGVMLQQLQKISFTPDLVASLENELQHQAMQIRNLDQVMVYHLVTMEGEWVEAIQSPMFDIKPRELDPLIGVLPKWARRETPGNLRADMRLTRACYWIWPGRWRNWMADELTQTIHIYDQIILARDQPALLWNYLTETKNAPKNNLITVSIPTLGRVYQQAFISRRVTILALELECYRLQHGDWPQTLTELAENKNITDPYSGHDLQYRQTDDGVVIYSLGPNGTDEGGVQDGIFVSDRDIAFRLLDPAVRGTLTKPEETLEPWE